MSRPRDGDQSSSEDGTLAQIIPLRRRAPDGETPFGQPPEPSGVFDPPDEPEPLAGYSVWERPAAELIRREQPEPPWSAARIAGALRSSALTPRLLLPSAAAVSAVAIAAVVALALGSGDQHGSRTGRGASARTSARASGAAPTAGGPPRLAARPKAPRTDRTRPKRRTVAKTHAKTQHRATSEAPLAQSTPPPSEGTALQASNQSTPAPSSASASVQEPPSTTAATTTSSSTTPPTGEGSHSTTSGAGEGAPTASAATREFGFEH
jgi:hypothetical protein